jgi:hypothetical protein
MASNISNHLGGVANALHVNNLFSGKDPAGIAASILQAASTGTSFVPAHQLDQVSAALDSLAQDDPKGAETVRGIVMNALSPMEQGELMRISCGAAKKHASVELGPIEDVPAPAASHAAEKQAPPQIAVGTVLLSDAKGSADGRRALPFFTEAQRLGTPEALRTAALSSIAVYNYEGATAAGVRRNDTDGAGQMKRIAGAQEELLSHVAADMGFPRSDTAVAMRSGYAALAGDATTPAQIRADAAQAVALIDASTTRWDGVLAAVKTNVTMPAQVQYDSRQRALTALANDGLTRDLANFQVTALGGAAISIAAPAVAGKVFVEGTALYFGTAATTGGTLNVALGEASRAITGETSTTGQRIGDFISGGFVVVGLTQFAKARPILAGAIGGGGGATFGSLTEQVIDRGSVNLSTVAFQTSIGVAAGTAGAQFGRDLKIQGVTSGRGNWLSNYNGGVTRISNGSAANISPMVSIKGGAAATVKATPSMVIETGVQTAVDITKQHIEAKAP